MDSKYLNISLVLIVLIVFSIIIYRNNLKQEIGTGVPVIIKPTLEDVASRLVGTETAQVDVTIWKEYTSKTSGLKFYYPPTFFYFKGNLYGREVELLLPETSTNRTFIKDPNSSEMPLGIISIHVKRFVDKFIAADYIKKNLQPDILKWKEAIFRENPGVIYTGQSADYFDGLTFIRNGFIYEFNVSFWPDNLPSKNDTEQVRDNYYEILSTIEFIK